MPTPPETVTLCWVFLLHPPVVLTLPPTVVLTLLPLFHLHPVLSTTPVPSTPLFYLPPTVVLTLLLAVPIHLLLQADLTHHTMFSLTYYYIQGLPPLVTVRVMQWHTPFWNSAVILMLLLDFKWLWELCNDILPSEKFTRCLGDNARVVWQWQLYNHWPTNSV